MVVLCSFAHHSTPSSNHTLTISFTIYWPYSNHHTLFLWWETSHALQFMSFFKRPFWKYSLPSRKLTYPTWGKGNIIFKMDFSGDMLVRGRVISNHDRVIQPGQGRVQCLCHPFLMLSSDSAFFHLQAEPKGSFSWGNPDFKRPFWDQIPQSDNPPNSGVELSICHGHDYLNWIFQ